MLFQRKRLENAALCDRLKADSTKKYKKFWMALQIIFRALRQAEQRSKMKQNALLRNAGKESGTMKRLIAGLLAAAMLFGFTPVNAFAAENDLLAPQPENTAAVSEELARSIAADPLLQNTAAAQTEQTQQAGMDPSEMSMQATTSFGQLLLDSMDEQNGQAGGYTSRITGLTLNGHTAAVEFVADRAADLVVAVYTDSTAEEMTASGTTAVLAGSGNGTEQVGLIGEIPEYYTVKAYLLDPATHEPLSAVYTDQSRTRVMVDLSTASVTDFPADRVVNLDNRSDTNFVVVAEGVTLITSNSRAGAQNQLLSQDDAGLVYVIGNASEEIRNLQKGDILTYEYEPGAMLVARVNDLTISGDTVTIYGDDTLEITDVFDAVKIEDDAANEELEYDSSAADPGVSYLGEEDADFSFVDQESGFLDATNSGSLEVGTIISKDPKKITGKASKKFEIKDEDSEIEGGVDDGEGTTIKSKISGTVNVGASATVAFYIASDYKYFSLSANIAMSGEFEIGKKIETRIRLGSFGFSPVAGCFICFEPTFVARAEGKLTAAVKTSATIGFSNDSTNGFQNISKAPKTQINVDLQGTLYVGLDAHPKVMILGSIVTAEVQAEIGGSGTFTRKTWFRDITLEDDSVHGCSVCYSVKLDVALNVSVTLKFLGLDKFSEKGTIIDQDWPLGDAYYAPDYKDFGMGSCPHTQYKVLISCDEAHSDDMEIILHQKNGSTEETSNVGKIGVLGYLKLYLDPGEYYATAVDGEDTYNTGIFTVSSAARNVKLSLYGGTDIDNPLDPKPDKPGQGGTDPDLPDGDADFALGFGILDINSANVMIDYSSVEETPWNADRDSVTRVNVAEGITRISSNALAKFANLKEVYLNGVVTEIAENAFADSTLLKDVYYAGTKAQWSTVRIGAGNEPLDTVTVHCKDGDVDGPGKIVSSGSKDGIQWIQTAAGTLTISGTGLLSEDLRWEWERDSIYNIVICDGITGMSDEMFAKFKNLRKVTVPGSMKKIPYEAFWECTSLTEVVLEDGIETIGWDAFSGDTALTEIVLPDSVKLIDSGAFEYCRNLRSIRLSQNLTAINNGAFLCCESLETIDLPESLEEIKYNAFGQCTSLTGVKLPENLSALGDSAFQGCTNLAGVMTIPQSITALGKETFSGCSSLTGVKLPTNLTEIGKAAFRSCTGITDITLPAGLETIGESAFESSGLTGIQIPETVTTIGKRAFALCAELSGTVTLPNGLKTVEEGTFSGCKKLSGVQLPEGVTAVGEMAFSGCTHLETIVLPDSVTEIGDTAFYGSGLKQITLSANLKTIGEKAFADCLFTELTLPESVRSIGAGAFLWCGKLKTINIPEGVTELLADTFSSCNELDEIALPVSLTHIGAGAFRNVWSMEAVHFAGSKEQWDAITVDDGNSPLQEAKIIYYKQAPTADSVIATGIYGAHTWELKQNGTFTMAGTGAMKNGTFKNAEADPGVTWYPVRDRIKAVILQDGITSVGDCAFLGCRNLETVELPTSITSIGQHTFRNCSSLQSITLPEGVTSIGRVAFDGCNVMTEISIPVTMKKIDMYAFDICDQLKTVRYAGTKAAWSEIGIENFNGSLTSAAIHCADGDIVPTADAEENSVASGSVKTEDTACTAVFEGAAAGREYVVIVSREESDPLNPVNLIYINQITAKSDGKLELPFRTMEDTGSIGYVVACAQDDVAVTPSQKPGSQGSTGSSGDNGGGGAIILIGGVVAVAAVVGVVLMMPVKVEGTVKLAGQPAVNVTLQVLKDGRVEAQTVTDANGQFAFELQRGSYTLRAAWTDAEGKPATRELSIEAPAEHLDLAL